MSKVFVFRRQPLLDYSDAERFGTIVDIAVGQKVNQYDAKEMGNFFSVALEDFDYTKDYILMAGTNIAIAQMFAFMLINFGQVKVLLYNPIDTKYFETKYNFEDYDYAS